MTHDIKFDELFKAIKSRTPSVNRSTYIVYRATGMLTTNRSGVSNSTFKIAFWLRGNNQALLNCSCFNNAFPLHRTCLGSNQKFDPIYVHSCALKRELHKELRRWWSPLCTLNVPCLLKHQRRLCFEIEKKIIGRFPETTPFPQHLQLKHFFIDGNGCLTWMPVTSARSHDTANALYQRFGSTNQYSGELGRIQQ